MKRFRKSVGLLPIRGRFEGWRRVAVELRKGLWEKGRIETKERDRVSVERKERGGSIGGKNVRIVRLLLAMRVDLNSPL